MVFLSNFNTIFDVSDDSLSADHRVNLIMRIEFCSYLIFDKELGIKNFSTIMINCANSDK